MPPKLWKKILVWHFLYNSGIFGAKIMQNSGILLIFHTYFRPKNLAPLKLTELIRYVNGTAKVNLSNDGAVQIILVNTCRPVKEKLWSLAFKFQISQGSAVI